MSDIDPFDDELGAALRQRAGAGTTSTAAAHDAVLRRAGTIRRRRAAIGGGSAMAVLLVGGIALLPRGADEIGPAVTGDVLPTFDEATTTVDEPADPSPTPTTVDLTIPGTDPQATPDTTVGTTITSSVVAPTTSTPRATTPSSTSVAATTPTTTDTTTDTSAPTTSAAEPAPGPFTETYQSVGGSITVTWGGSTLSLVSVAPANGFVAEVEQSSATRVRVRFESDAVDSRIEVRVDGGQVSVDID